MERFTTLGDFADEGLESAIDSLDYVVKGWIVSQGKPEFDGVTREPTPEDRAELADAEFNFEAIVKACKLLTMLRAAWLEFYDLRELLTGKGEEMHNAHIDPNLVNEPCDVDNGMMCTPCYRHAVKTLTADELHKLWEMWEPAKLKAAYLEYHDPDGKF